MLRKFGLTTALVLAGLATPAISEEHYVLMMGHGYFPNVVHVVPGDTVRFINSSAFPMTATADNGQWDTGIVQPGEEVVLTVTQNFKETYQNTYLDAVDQYGVTVGLNATGIVDRNKTADIWKNPITGATYDYSS